MTEATTSHPQPAPRPRLNFRSRRPTSKLRAAAGVWVLVAMSFLSLRLLIREYKLPSVVRIEVRNNGDPGAGSCVAVAVGKHELLTVYHGVGDATEIYIVTTDGDYIPASLAAVDPMRDAAKIVTGWWATFDPVELSSTDVAPGDAVTIKFMSDYVADTRRARVLDVTTVPGKGEVIMLRAPAWPGMSGSAVLDDSDRLVGLLTAGAQNRSTAVNLHQCEFIDPATPSPLRAALEVERHYGSLVRAEDAAGALALAEQLRSVTPANATYWLECARQLYLLDRRDEAIDAACDGLNRFSTNRWACQTFGALLASLGESEEAVAAISRFRESGERDPIIVRAQASVLADRGRHSEAVGVLDRWLARWSLDWGVCISLIEALGVLGLHTEARLVALELLRHNDDDPATIRLIARTSRDAGFLEEADLYDEIAAWYVGDE